MQFDERGNAIWEWAVSTGAFGREVSTERMKKLENPGLSLADDAPTPFDKVKPNPQGVVKGYNPYDSGKLGRSGPPPKKKDLKKLSDWLQLKKQAENNRARRRRIGAAGRRAVWITRSRSGASPSFPDDRTCAARAPAARLGRSPGSRSGAPGAGRN